MLIHAATTLDDSYGKQWTITLASTPIQMFLLLPLNLWMVQLSPNTLKHPSQGPDPVNTDPAVFSRQKSSSYVLEGYKDTQIKAKSTFFRQNLHNMAT